ncbi:hypothetical protein TSOC_002507 [Tetrabaena socialis]|uniref:AB hydrolase-1 domain-containing protein n=1 Tax=Tetrabaena socialis TaxID=47790 RepID=A0A2J8ADW9_9CHLO|nr:hypothetical protein TSOC_002507 [Tetrabaena socialis]|eukprot:PNH10710.1 hypothetical protein TSOC_002507 [Tetrabaena socialis]
MSSSAATRSALATIAAAAAGEATAPQPSRGPPPTRCGAPAEAGAQAAGAADAGGAAHAQPEPGAEAGAEPGAEPPLVFLHGIGLGLAPYLRLLRRTVAAGGGRRVVYAVQYKHVSMRLTTTIPAPHEVAADVAAFLAGQPHASATNASVRSKQRAHRCRPALSRPTMSPCDISPTCRTQGVTRVSVLAHSYGTLVASALNKLAVAAAAAAGSRGGGGGGGGAGGGGAPAICRLTLVDPVCFAMFLPHLVRNTIYQLPLVPQQQQQEEQQQQQQQHQQAQQQQQVRQQEEAHFDRGADAGTAGKQAGGSPAQQQLEGEGQRQHRHRQQEQQEQGQQEQGQQLRQCDGVEAAAEAVAAAAADAAAEAEAEVAAVAAAEGAGGAGADLGGQPGRLVAVRRRLLRSLLRGLVVAEFHCSVALRRRLDWGRVNLWPSELPPGTTVVLSGRDNLVPVREASRASLLGPLAAPLLPTVLFHQHLGHGGFLSDDPWQERVLAAALGTPLAEPFRVSGGGAAGSPGGSGSRDARL